MPHGGPLPQEAYGKEATERTYGRLIEDAKTALAAGMTVIADAVYADPAERDALEQAARRGRRAVPRVLDRCAAGSPDRAGIGRADDASDATVDFLRAHPTREQGPMGWTASMHPVRWQTTAERLLRHGLTQVITNPAG